MAVLVPFRLHASTSSACNAVAGVYTPVALVGYVFRTGIDRAAAFALSCGNTRSVHCSDHGTQGFSSSTCLASGSVQWQAAVLVLA